MRIALWLWLLLVGLLPSAGQAQEVLPIAFRLEDLAERPSAEPQQEILVTGQRLRGAPIGDIPPLLRLDERDIAAYGAGTVDELIEALSPQTRTPGGSRPVVLVNGQRIASLAEVRDFPPEAVERIDILPEEVALRYGYRADQKVVNLVLRPRFRAVSAEAVHGFATDGGRSTYQADLTVSRIREAGRWSVNARYQRTGALFESERELDGGLGRFRSLQPRTKRARLGGSFTRELAPNVPATVTASVEWRENDSRIGRFDEAGAESRPLRRRTASHAANLGLSIHGPIGDWQWTFTGSADRSRSETRSEIADASRALRRDRVRTDLTFADAQLLAYGELARLPAGAIGATFRLEVGANVHSGRALFAGRGQMSRLSRIRGAGQAAFDVPLAGPGAFGVIGSISANLDIALETLSDFGTISRFGYGLRWAPIPQVSLALFRQDTETAPTVPELGDPPLLTPNVRLFDYVRGETVDVERLDGGNPVLLAQRRRSTRLSLSVRPLARHDLVLSATYLNSRISDPLGALPAASVEVEAAFPERFVRSADGRLLRIDARPVNFSRAEQEQVRWGFAFSKVLAATPASVAPQTAGDRPDLRPLLGERDRSGRIQLAAYVNWRLRERLLIRPGLPRLDLLGDDVGSRPQRDVEAQAGLFRSGFGIRLNLTWQDAHRLRGIERPGGGVGELRFSSIARVDFQFFADLGEQPWLMARAPWLRGTRVALAADNVFNARQRVRDETGATPQGFQPAYLDPVGRSVRLSIRRLF